MSIIYGSLLSSCGGGGASSGGPQPNFSLSTQPATLVIAPGGTQPIQISVNAVNGFSGSVQVTATPPSGISVSPSSLSLSPGTPQQLTITAAQNMAPGTVTVSFTGNSGSLSHMLRLEAEIQTAGAGPHPPFRSRYLRTDIQYNPNSLQYFPPHFTAYDSVRKHYFVSNTTLNRIDVFDATSESEVGSVLLPMPWGIDISPDGSKMYVGTAIGDIYTIDPGGLTVLQRYPAASIGYEALEPFILANGQLALLGGTAAFNVDGSQTFAIWDPATNNLNVFYPYTIFGLDFRIGQMVLTADRTKVIVSSADSDSALGLYDPSTGNGISSHATGIVDQILTTPDGSRIWATHASGLFEAFDANTLAALGSFMSSSIYGCESAILSYDGSTLFSDDPTGNVTAYDTKTFGPRGWVPNFNVVDLQSSIALSLIDETGLAVGPIGHGFAFLDTTQIKPGTGPTIFQIGFLSPGSGTLNGGTAFQAKVSEANATGPENITSGTIYIGNATADNVSLSNTQATGQTPPASIGGPADFAVVLPDGSVQLNPEDFSYGPTIVELSTNAASAEGGAQGVIFGYGLGQQPSDLTVNVGGQPAQVTQVIPSVAPIYPYPFPMEAALFTIPAGTAGTRATVTATTAAGSVTSPTQLTYVPAVQTFTSSPGALMQGIYDNGRGVIYFTDQSQIDVFSISANNWTAPITISYTNGSSRLMGVSLSPDRNTLAIADAGLGNIYVLNPSNPSQVKSFYVAGSVGSPYAVAVTNSGIVYYSAFDGEDPPVIYQKIDSSTGKITTYQLFGDSSFDRLVLNPQGTEVYGSGPFVINTATDLITVGIQAENNGDGSIDLALSGDGSTLIASDMVTDANLNVESDNTYVDRDVWLPLAVYGQKLNSDGSLLFQPITDGIDVHDVRLGLLTYRVALPIELADAFDALVIDDQDGLLFAITPTGIGEINLSSLPAAAFKRGWHSRKRALPLPTSSIMRAVSGEQGRRGSQFDRTHLQYRQHH